MDKCNTDASSDMNDMSQYQIKSGYAKAVEAQYKAQPNYGDKAATEATGGGLHGAHRNTQAGP